MADRKKRTPRTTRNRNGRADRTQTGGGAPSNGNPPGPPEDLIRKWFAEARQGHREDADAFALSIISSPELVKWLFGLEDWTVVTPLPRDRLDGEGGRKIDPDGLCFCSMIPGDTPTQATERFRRTPKAGAPESGRVAILSIEARLHQQLGRDGDQLYETRKAIRRRFGRMMPVDSAQLLVGSGARSRETVPVAGGTTQRGPLHAPVVCLDQVDADQAPEAVRSTTFGLIALLAMRNGDTPRHVRPVLDRIFGSGDDDLDPTALAALDTVMRLRPQLYNVVVPELLARQEGRAMANGTVVADASYTKMFHRLVNDLVEGTKDKTKVPVIRKLIEARDREQRKRERAQQLHEQKQQKLEREHQQKQQKLEREHEQKQQKLEREVQARHVDGLLSTLAGRGMRLTAAQEKRLYAKPLAKLPPLKTARQAKDAADFARRAGLTNGRK